VEEQVIDIDGQVLTKATNSYGRIEYLNSKGELHRTGGPARIWSDGYQEYWVNGKQHRTDGSSYIDPNGYRGYWVNDKRHRLDGPAEIYPDGIKVYYVDDIYYTKDEYPKAVLTYKLKQLVG
jgi:hypothetical protein